MANREAPTDWIEHHAALVTTGVARFADVERLLRDAYERGWTEGRVSAFEHTLRAAGLLPQTEDGGEHG